MRLIIYFDRKIDISSYDHNDLILTSSFSLYKIYKDRINIVLLDYTIDDESPKASKAINQFFDDLPLEFLPYRNTYFMRVFRPIHAVILQVEKLREKYAIDTLILKGGSDFKFITLNGGEGEGDHKFFRSSWLINPFLYHYFKDEMKIQWLNRRPKFLFSTIHSFRESLILIKFVKRYVKASLKIRIKYINKKLDFHPIYAFAYVPLQINHFKSIFDESIKDRIIYISPENLNIVEKRVHHYSLNILDYAKAIKLFLQVKRNINSSLTYRLNGKEISFDSKILTRSIRFNFIQFNANLKSLKNYFHNSKVGAGIFFISNMTFGEDIVLVNELSKYFEVPHFNFQAVAMSKMLFPQMKLADKYFLYSHHTFSFYKDIESSYRYYFPNINSTVRNGLKNECLITLTLFTQPDAFADRYLTFLKEFMPFIGGLNNKIHLIIKPHYRQNKIDKFRELIINNPHIHLETKETLPEEIINKSDFILSISSSVLFESIQLNCPAIILDLEGIDEKFIVNVCFPEVNFRIQTYDELYSILQNPVKYINLFRLRKARFIQEYAGQTDVNNVFHVN